MSRHFLLRVSLRIGAAAELAKRKNGDKKLVKRSEKTFVFDTWAVLDNVLAEFIFWKWASESCSILISEIEKALQVRAVLLLAARYKRPDQSQAVSCTIQILNRRHKWLKTEQVF